MNSFLGTQILWILFGIITKLDYIWGPFLCILGSFQYKLGIYFWVAKISNIFGVLEIPDIY